MILKEAYIEGFGKYKKKEIRFAPGLNVFHGENESGKTTLSRFVIHMLYGMKKPGLRRKVYLEEYTQYKPWDISQYGGTLTYESQGHTYRVERDFDKDGEVVRVFDLSQGREITLDFPVDERREVLFAPEHTGASEYLFYATHVMAPFNTAVQQEDARKQALYKDIQNSITGRTEWNEDPSLTTAVNALRRAMDVLGTPRTKTKPLGIALRQMEEVQEQVHLVEKFRSDIMELEKELGDKTREIQDLEYKIANYERNLTLKKRDELQKRWAGIKTALEKRDQCKQQLEALGLPVDSRMIRDLENAARSLGDLQRLKDQYSALEREVLELQEQMKTFEDDGSQVLENSLTMEETYALVDDYQEYQHSRNILRAKEMEVEILIQKVERASRKLEAYRFFMDCPDILSQIAGIEERIKTFEEKETMNQLEQLDGQKKLILKEQNKYTLTMAGLGAAAAAALILGAAVHFTLFLLAPLSGYGIFRLFKKWSDCKSRLTGINQKIEAQEALFFSREAEKQILQQDIKGLCELTGLGDLSTIKERSLHAAELGKEWQEAKEELQQLDIWLEENVAQISQREQRILQGLDRLGHKNLRLEDLSSGQFHRMVEDHKDWLHKSRQMEEQLTRLKEKKVRLQSLDAELIQQRKQCAASLGMEQNHPGFHHLQAADPMEFINLLRDYRHYREVAEELLQGETPEMIEMEIQELELHSAEEQPAAAADWDHANLEVKEMQKQLTVLKGHKMVIESKLKDYHNRMESYGDVVVALDKADEELMTLTLRKEALETAAAALEEVSREFHQDVFPQIMESMKSILTHVTRGRYQEVHIDDSLAVRFLEPSTKHLEKMEMLSSGTQDQFMFAFQVALAEVLIPQENLFFLMDDPFIQYDLGRKKQAFQWMDRLASRHQMHYFTCHRQDYKLLERKFKNVNVVLLNE